MKPVLTKGSSLSCDHPKIGGAPVDLSGRSSVLKVDGDDVLAGSLGGASMKALMCSQVPTNAQPNNKQCSSVATQSGGTSKVLFIDGQAALLEGLTGETADGNPDKKWSEKGANQSVLRAD